MLRHNAAEWRHPSPVGVGASGADGVARGRVAHFPIEHNHCAHVELVVTHRARAMVEAQPRLVLDFNAILCLASGQVARCHDELELAIIR